MKKFFLLSGNSHRHFLIPPYFLGFLATLSLCFFVSSASAANLTAQGVSVKDISGASRTSFSSNEMVVMLQKVENSTTSASMIYFTFYILDPAGSVAFKHTGNAAPGTPGLTQSQISGIVVNQFYSIPGEYTFRGKAVLDSDTVIQETKFTVSSPNITLIYPPYGVRNLSDKPLIFRWTSSGASKYKITVSDNAGLHNAVHTHTNTGESSYSYPENSTLPREQLSPGEIYYWKIDGLDSSNNVISESLVYNFSIKSESAGQSRNIKVVSIVLSAPMNDWTKPGNFKVKVINEGSTNETNINLKFTLSGVNAQDSPKTISILNSKQTTELPFTAFAPQEQKQALAVACVDTFDDNTTDNCKTLLLSRDVKSSGYSGKKMSYDEMWEAIKKRLGPEALKALEDYTFTSITCSDCVGAELSDLLAALANGGADISGLMVEGKKGSSVSSADSATSYSSSLNPSFGDLSLSRDFFTELAGFTGAFNNKKTLSFAIRKRKKWKKIWRKISSNKDVPEVDFARKMLIVIVSAPKSRAQLIRLLGKRVSKNGFAFDYYFIKAAKGVKTPSPAYLIKAVDKAEGKLKFNRLDMK